MNDRSSCAELRGLAVSFFGRPVLKGVDVRFPARRISVILGRSGSGKSTLLRSINRLNECFEGYEEEGEVRVLLGGTMRPTRGDGAPSPHELRRRVGMVFQSPNPLPMSVRRNLTLPLELASPARPSRQEVRERLQRALEQTGLWDEVRDRLDAPAASLSGGQQQRLCLARALALGPELLLLDEPTSSLDRAAAARIEDMLLSMRGRVSIVLVSHSLTQARRLADFAVVLAEGRLLRTFDAPSLGAAIDDGSLVREVF